MLKFKFFCINKIKENENNKMMKIHRLVIKIPNSNLNETISIFSFKYAKKILNCFLFIIPQAKTLKNQNNHLIDI